MANNNSIAKKFGEYERRLRRKSGNDISMKQVACSFGGLYAIIYLLQYFSIFTLLIGGVVLYIVYDQIMHVFQLQSASGAPAASAPPAPKPSKPSKGKKSTKDN
mmetsp:Transcript_2213/g.4662  ORF Transcript_2213/g.4662 Transcript_2213/m.4662 type:complete len:104 (-) Transcript_2213:139-450(-)|eukprot:CAMPEP_0178459722 /NCGR_PEP_ID=MMETSP0689_2-20121128/48294_1 /TAXON_ID=160604 /ORGANISM="Amphidinium massartii, Strain CS-259" /LENGTH=103 /DNA_ID=CAMNT_0020086243 /DNA_START=107 /DNA_END=418 /DNA_ORIENTATION=+